jgi:hypothetical protein
MIDRKLKNCLEMSSTLPEARQRDSSDTTGVIDNVLLNITADVADICLTKRVIVKSWRWSLFDGSGSV